MTSKKQAEKNKKNNVNKPSQIQSLKLNKLELEQFDGAFGCSRDQAISMGGDSSPFISQNQIQNQIL